MNLYKIIHSQTKIFEQGQSPVGGNCYRTIYTTFKTKFKSLFIPIIGAMAIAPYGAKSLLARFYFMRILFDGRLKPYPTSFKFSKHYNLTYFSQKLFFNVKIVEKY